MIGYSIKHLIIKEKTTVIKVNGNDQTNDQSKDQTVNVPCFSWVLGSQSPRRKTLLKYLGVPFDSLPANIDESIKATEKPSVYALRMAEEKALKVAEKLAQQELKNSMAKPTLIIGGDTVVALGEKVLGKPLSESEALATLTELAGQEHQVWSAWAVVQFMHGQEPIILTSGVSKSTVNMRELTKDEIIEYIASGEPMDKAGSYGIQGQGGRFVSRVEGSFFSVIGLPMLDLYTALVEKGLIFDQTGFIKRGIELRERVAFAAWRSGRSVDAVNVLAVSKFHSLESIKQAYMCDFEHFGESYVQELLNKHDELKQYQQQLGPADRSNYEPVWHYIGGIQTNKAKRIGENSHWVHGLSRFSEAQKLAQGAQASGNSIQAFIQVNLAKEKSKSGLDEAKLRSLLEACEKLNGLKVVGLMTFPPLDEPENNRKYFRVLRTLRDQLESEGYHLPHLSMGTSDDFEVAIEEGSTWVRLGRSLFGERPQA